MTETTSIIHLSNAVTNLIPEKRELHYMYEDNDIDGDDDARAFFSWIEQYAPGQFVLIETGDYIIPPCADHNKVGLDAMHIECATYDPRYSLCLVPVSVWNDCKDEVLKADSAWREEKMKCTSVSLNRK